MHIYDRLRDLDNWVMGKVVPDERPPAQRMLEPRPAVWSRSGRIIYGLVILGAVAVLRWGSDNLLSNLALMALFGVALLVTFADERKRSRRYYEGLQKQHTETH